MSDIHISRIEHRLDQLFSGLIDLSDVSQHPAERQRDFFLTRSLAAYGIACLSDADPSAAACAVTDGFDDEGLDALYYDSPTKMLYLVQSKWSKDGNKGIDRGDNQKFLQGIRLLLRNQLQNFNERIRAKSDEIRAALLDPYAQFTIVLISTAEQPVSQHIKRDVEAEMSQINGQGVTLIHFSPFDQDRVYKSLLASVDGNAINLDITLYEWGMVKDPYASFYGQVDIGDVLSWRDKGVALFARNLRNFAGPSDVHASVTDTLGKDPAHFWYYNNGATMLCASIAKKPIFANNREKGIFECKGVSIVNGAQTIGTIWDIADAGEELSPVTRLHLRIISLEKCPPEFATELTRAANTQKRIERRDFAALDKNQHRLAIEMSLDGRQYVFRSGDPDPPSSTGCGIVEATIALACAANDLSLAVQAKREISKLWEDIKQPPYTILFNDELTSEVLWRSVRILRAVDLVLSDKQLMASLPQGEMVAVHGNRFILYRVFKDPQVQPFRNRSVPIETFEEIARKVARRELQRVARHLSANEPGATSKRYSRMPLDARRWIYPFRTKMEPSPDPERADGYLIRTIQNKPGALTIQTQRAQQHMLSDTTPLWNRREVDMVTNRELTQFLKNNRPANKFVPYCYLSKESDTLTVYFEGDADYSKRLNDHITLYLSLETDEIVGCRIKGISSILADLPNYLRVTHGCVKLAVLFFAFRGRAEGNEAEAINDLARVASEREMVFEPSI